MKICLAYARATPVAVALLTVVTLPAHEGKDERTFGLYRKVRVLTQAQVKALGYLPSHSHVREHV